MQNHASFFKKGNPFQIEQQHEGLWETLNSIGCKQSQVIRFSVAQWERIHEWTFSSGLTPGQWSMPVPGPQLSSGFSQSKNRNVEGFRKNPFRWGRVRQSASHSPSMEDESVLHMENGIAMVTFCDPENSSSFQSWGFLCHLYNSLFIFIVNVIHASVTKRHLYLFLWLQFFWASLNVD